MLNFSFDPEPKMKMQVKVILYAHTIFPITMILGEVFVIKDEYKGHWPDFTLQLKFQHVKEEAAQF